jgi:hypothetical protein
MDDIIAQGRDRGQPQNLDLEAIQNKDAVSALTKVAAWISDRNLPFARLSMNLL